VSEAQKKKNPEKRKKKGEEERWAQKRRGPRILERNDIERGGQRRDPWEEKSLLDLLPKKKTDQQGKKSTTRFHEKKKKRGPASKLWEKKRGPLFANPDESHKKGTGGRNYFL